MTESLLAVYRRAADLAVAIVERVHPDQLGDATPQSAMAIDQETFTTSSLVSAREYAQAQAFANADATHVGEAEVDPGVALAIQLVAQHFELRPDRAEVA